MAHSYQDAVYAAFADELEKIALDKEAMSRLVKAHALVRRKIPRALSGAVGNTGRKVYGLAGSVPLPSSVKHGVHRVGHGLAHATGWHEGAHEVASRINDFGHMGHQVLQAFGHG